MTTKILAFCLVLCAFLILSCSNKSENFSASSKSDLIHDFVLGYWWGPAPQKQSADTWKLVKEANFNTCGLNWDFSVEDNKKMIAECNKLGLSSWVVDERVKLGKTDANAVYDDYQNEKGISAMYVMDEPGAAQFQPSKDIADIFRKRNKNILPFVNLFPIYASADQLGMKTYADYLEEYVRVYKPEVLSFDHYALTDSGERRDYYANLQAFLKVKKKYHLPVWNTVLSYEHLFYIRPNAADMRWQIYTSLAYGVTGILYFTYYPCLTFGVSKTAVVDADGKPTELYGIVRDLNKDILSLKNVFLGLEIKDVRHTADNFIVSEFESKDKNDKATYLMVTNKSRIVSGEMKLPTLLKQAALFEVGSGRFEDKTLVKGILNVKLLPGEGKILRLR